MPPPPLSGGIKKSGSRLRVTIIIRQKVQENTHVNSGIMKYHLKIGKKIATKKVKKIVSEFWYVIFFSVKG